MGLLLGQKLLGHDIDHMAVNTESNYQEIKSCQEPASDSYVTIKTVQERTRSDAP